VGRRVLSAVVLHRNSRTGIHRDDRTHRTRLSVGFAFGINSFENSRFSDDPEALAPIVCRIFIQPYFSASHRDTSFQLYPIVSQLAQRHPIPTVFCRIQTPHSNCILSHTDTPFQLYLRTDSVGPLCFKTRSIVQQSSSYRLTVPAIGLLNVSPDRSTEAVSCFWGVRCQLSSIIGLALDRCRVGGCVFDRLRVRLGDGRLPRSLSIGQESPSAFCGLQAVLSLRSRFNRESGPGAERVDRLRDARRGRPRGDHRLPASIVLTM